jgi:hypothetical protein
MAPRPAARSPSLGYPAPPFSGVWPAVRALLESSAGLVAINADPDNAFADGLHAGELQAPHLRAAPSFARPPCLVCGRKLSLDKLPSQFASGWRQNDFNGSANPRLLQALTAGVGPAVAARLVTRPLLATYFLDLRPPVRRR